MLWSYWAAVLIASVVHVGHAQTPAVTPPMEAEFREQIGRLHRKNDQTIRLKALKWLIEHSAEKHAETASLALEVIVRQDPDEKVRQEAVVALGRLAKNQGKPCPLLLLEAVLDENVFVRQAAEALSGVFTTFTPGAVEVLLRAAWSEDDDIRGASLNLLAQAAPCDKKVLAVIETAKHDKVFGVRHNAYCAKFKANDKLDEFLAWMVRLQEDEKAVLHPVPEDRELRERAKAVRDMAVLGSAIRIVEWCDERPNELATALLLLLDNKSPAMRRGAARLIGAAVVKVNLADPDKSGKDNSTRALSYPYPDKASSRPKPGSQPEPPPVKSKVAAPLEKRNVRERLENVGESNPDPTVRGAARRALDALARVQEREP